MKILRLATVVAMVSIVALAFGQAAKAEPFKLNGEPKPAWLYFDVKSDGGWTQAAHESRLRVEKHFGWNIPFVEKIPEEVSATKAAAEKYISRGHKIIIGGGFGHSDAFLELSEKYPDVAFILPAGATNSNNLQGIYGRTYEAHYLCGMAAGALSKANKIGYVAANPYGIVNWAVNAYLIGARKTNPNITLNVVYTGAWNDPIKERAAAQALVEQGVDVIGQHVDTPTPQIVAQENGLYATGHHRDMSEFAPKATQCSQAWVWDRYLIPKIQEMIDGVWDPAAKPYGDFIHIHDGGNDIVCCGDAVPAATVTMINDEKDAMANGKHVFEGPLYDQAGTLRVKEGEVPSDGDLWGMDWLLQGIVGTTKTL